MFNFFRVDEKEKVLGLQRNLTQLYGVNYSSVLSNNTEEIEELNGAIATEKFQIHMYSIMIFISTAAALVKTYVLLSYCRRASINIHKSMLASILKAPMIFFDTHFIGNILNRFSQDMNNVDEMLPFVFTECFRVRNRNYFSKQNIFIILYFFIPRRWILGVVCGCWYNVYHHHSSLGFPDLYLHIFGFSGYSANNIFANR